MWFTEENIATFCLERRNLKMYVNVKPRVGVPYRYCLAVWFPESVARLSCRSVFDALQCQRQEGLEADPV